jgi:outer membrane receptor protein involved in Fe transport
MLLHARSRDRRLQRTGPSAPGRLPLAGFALLALLFVAPRLLAQEGDEDPSEDGFGDTFAPSWDEEDEDEDEDAEDAFGDTFAPSWDDDEEEEEAEESFGDTFAPSWDEDDEGDTEPAAPASDDSRWLTDEGDEDAEEEEDWERYWELLGPQNVQERVEVPTELDDGLGGIRGVVLSDADSEPVYGVEILVESTGETLTTGSTGQFFFPLEPGFHVLRFRHFSYRAEGYEIEVEEGVVTDMGAVRLVEDAARTMTQVVEGRADQNTVAQQLLERREQAAMTNAISAEEMSRSSDGSASSAVGRVVGVSVVDNQFVYIRGLGGRYVRVMFNGINVPATDPDFPGASVDLFPSGLLANLTLQKTLTADQPGDAAGGLVNIVSREYPEEFTADVGVSIGGDSLSTFRREGMEPGGSLDWLGRDDGTRRLPDAVPADRRVEPGSLSAEEIEAAGEGFRNAWEPEARVLRPNLSVNGQVGDSIPVGGGTLGYLLAVRYGNRMERRAPGTNRLLSVAGDALSVIETMEVTQVRERTLLGTLLNVGWSPNSRHEVEAVVLWNQSGESLAEVVAGRAQEEEDFIRRTQLQWIQRQLLFAQLRGAHRGLPADSDLQWRFSLAEATRQEPDTRFLVQTSEDLIWRPNPGSGERFNADMTQRDLSGGLDWTSRPRLTTRLRVGGAAASSVRAFDSRRFRYRPSEFAVRRLPADEIFTPENIGSTVTIGEVTQVTDSYETRQTSLAGYGLWDVDLRPWLRWYAGARYESFTQDVSALSPWAPSGQSALEATREDRDVLPSTSLVFQLDPDRHYVRLAWAMTVARPTARDVAPFLFQDYVRRRTISGNPDLERTQVQNVDLRWELYPTRSQLFAVTGFFKEFRRPIEYTIVDVRGNIVAANADSATNLGIELEARTSLEAIADPLESLSLSANLALISSRIDLPECDPIRSTGDVCAEPSYTSRQRRLAGQTPWAINAALTWERSGSPWSSTLTYQVLGPRIEEVGALGLPDMVGISPHRVDLVSQYRLRSGWRLTGAATNLLNQQWRMRQGDIDVVEMPIGLGFQLGLRWESTPRGE